MHCYRWRVCGWNTWRVSDRYEWTVSSEYALGEACRRVGVDYKHLYLQANVEARAIADRFRRAQSSKRHDLETRMRERVGELLQERGEAGYGGVSAREVWQRLGPGLNSVRHSYRHIGTVVAAND